MTKKTKFINGVCQQLLFSPKGDIEGVLIRENGAVVQVSMSPQTGAIFARFSAAGSRVCVVAEPDHSPKTKGGQHPVYEFESFADAAGHAIDPPPEDSGMTTIDGVVATLHFARHGQPNGVVLETGEFIHLRPHGMAQSLLKVGAAVRAVGDVRMTLLGNRLLDAHEINGIEIA
jgi:hypothetical protein